MPISQGPSKCLACGGAMEEGVGVDHGHHNESLQPEWIRGQPEFGFFGGMKTRGKERRNVLTYRCLSCGRLESYAGPVL